jgi:hypothetical protein
LAKRESRPRRGDRADRFTTPRRSLRRLLAVVWLLSLPAHVPASPEAGPEEEEDDVGGRWDLVVEADLELVAEDQGGETAGEITFDEVGVVLEGAWWQLETGIKWESEGDRGVLVEEVSLEVGDEERWPGFARAGRTVVPFAESDSRFIEDPLTVVLGETDDDTVVLGYRGERLEASVSAYPGELAGDGDLDFAASLIAEVSGGWSLGLSWTSDLTEAVELRELRDEFREEDPSVSAPTDVVRGIAGFVSRKWDRVLARWELVTAIEEFAAGHLDEGAVRPSAASLELTLRVSERWALSGRAETSSELAGHPERQMGLAASGELSDFVTATGEYLHGSFDGEPDRDAVALMLAFEL